MTSVEALESAHGVLPADYASFLSALSEDLAAESDALVYGLESIAERNETLEVAKYCPGHLAIGDNGGGTAIVLSLRDGVISLVDMGAMSPDCFHPLADNFTQWQMAGFPCEVE